MLISVQSSQAIYKHVVVVWRNKIIDFECMHTYPLTEESLRQVCGIHTTFTDGGTQEASKPHGTLLGSQQTSPAEGTVIEPATEAGGDKERMQSMSMVEGG
jgi:hypothetical protein